MKNPNIRNFVAVICVFVIFYLISINHRSTVIFANKRLHLGHGNEKSINSLEKSITKLLVLAYPRYDNSIISIVSMDKYFLFIFSYITLRCTTWENTFRYIWGEIICKLLTIISRKLISNFLLSTY